VAWGMTYQSGAVRRPVRTGHVKALQRHHRHVLPVAPIVLLGPRAVGHPLAVVVAEAPGRLERRPTSDRGARSPLGEEGGTGALRSDVRRPLGSATGARRATARLARWCDEPQCSGVPLVAVGNPGVVTTFSATTALPYEHLQRATAGLRGQLRLLAVDAGEVPDWSTLAVTGPTESIGAHGRIWFEWSADVLAGVDALPYDPRNIAG
jgi:hypothetical protein